MRILLLGGTAFLSAATARAALRRGHHVTCLARATTADPPQGASLVRADRDRGPEAYAQVGAQEWDAVIDVSSQPVQVRQALAALAGRTRHWTFVSTVSVYADDTTPDQDESAPTHEPHPADRFTAMSDYGAAKVACENAVAGALGERAHIVRAGLIGGPGDGSDRVGYWPARFARTADDDVLVPAAGGPVQLIDVDDLASWIVEAAERGLAATVNATGESVGLPEVLELAQRITGHRGRRVPVAAEFLLENGVAHWAGPESLPRWLPAEATGFGTRSLTAAKELGLRLRPLEETLRRALEDERERGLDRERRAGLSPATERRVLAAWRAQRGQDAEAPSTGPRP
jgi:nucleoside-diphosphate-sugar epimerase